jgi:phosphatidylglycerophosphatase A
MSTIIGTFLYVGYMKPAPGTWGSLAALPVFWALYVLAGPIAALGFIGLAFVAGIWATKRMTAGSDNHDPSEIVIDEVVGQGIALFPVLYGATYAGADVLALWPGWIAAFVLFRLFDILKPGPIGWADRRGDAMGVMLDDVIAGVYAAIGVIILAVLYHVVWL